MDLKATEFRKHLFQVLDSALRGETVEICYKGSKLRLSAPPAGDRLSRAVRRHSLMVPSQSIVESDGQLMAELDARWASDDAAL